MLESGDCEKIILGKLVYGDKLPDSSELSDTFSGLEVLLKHFGG